MNKWIYEINTDKKKHSERCGILTFYKDIQIC